MSCQIIYNNQKYSIESFKDFLDNNKSIFLQDFISQDIQGFKEFNKTIDIQVNRFEVIEDYSGENEQLKELYSKVRNTEGNVVYLYRGNEIENYIKLVKEMEKDGTIIKSCRI